MTYPTGALRVPLGGMTSVERVVVWSLQLRQQQPSSGLGMRVGAEVRLRRLLRLKAETAGKALLRPDVANVGKMKNRKILRDAILLYWGRLGGYAGNICLNRRCSMVHFGHICDRFLLVPSNL